MDAGSIGNDLQSPVMQAGTNILDSHLFSLFCI
jgi:hypothetical protein